MKVVSVTLIPLHDDKRTIDDYMIKVVMAFPVKNATRAEAEQRKQLVIKALKETLE